MDNKSPISGGVTNLVEYVKQYFKIYFKKHPLIKMIAASEMKKEKSNHINTQEQKVIDELRNALDFENDFVYEYLTKLYEDLIKAIDPIVNDTLVKIFTYQLNKIDLSYLEVDNCLNDFYYGRMNQKEVDKLSNEMINKLIN